MYITNWHRLMGQSISHCMRLKGHTRLLWTRSQMIFLCSPQPAAVSTASDSAPYCFDFEPAKQEMTCHFNRGLFPTYSASTPNISLFQLYQYLRQDMQKDLFEFNPLQWRSFRQFPGGLRVFWTVSGLKRFTDRVATTEMRRWSNECHHREEIEYCHLNFLCFGQSQEAAYADAGTRLFHTLCLSESYKSDSSFMPWTSRLSSPYNLFL